MSTFSFSFPVATALRETLPTYTKEAFRHDLMAGFVVSTIALPLAMALSIAVGLPPQHGLYTAVIAGIAAALFGGSRLQVSGPTAAFVVILAPIVAEQGLNGLLWAQIMAGIMILLMAVTRLGRYINYIPYPVTTGFTAGIGVVIATLSLNDFLGLGLTGLQGDFLQKLWIIITHLSQINPIELAIGLLTFAIILYKGKITKILPSPLLGIGFATLTTWVLTQNGMEIATIASRFSYETPTGLAHGIPPYPPVFQLPTPIEWETFKELLKPAFVIAILAALESLLSATVADNMARTKHNPNAELNGIGIANILAALTGGIAATGAIARTATNIHAGAKSPLAAVIHALLVLAYMLALAPLMGNVPMSALSALLIITAWRMAHVKQVIHTLKVAPRADSAVLLTCLALTVLIDMVAGVSAGIVLASVLFIRRMTQLTQVDVQSFTHLPETEQESGKETPDNVMVYRIEGPLFFGSVEKAFDRYSFVHDHIERVVIDLSAVPMIDMTGLVALKGMLLSILTEGRTVFVCGKPHIQSAIRLKLGPEAAAHIHMTATADEALEDLTGTRR